MEGWVIADFVVDLTVGNVFNERSVLFACVISASKFLERIRENLPSIDHHEVVFIQRWGEAVEI